MPAKDLGSKHLCFKCGTKFYDMKKPVPVCPKCGADQRECPVQKAPPPERRSRAAKHAEPLPEVAEADGEPGEDDDGEDDDEDEDDDV